MSGFDAFFEQEIQAASGPELRRLLLQKAVGLCGVVREGWASGDRATADQWMLRIHDILIELLEGVQDRQNAVAATISDLYVYLLKLSHESAAARSTEGIISLQQILEIELETWTLVARDENSHGDGDSKSLDSSRQSTAAGYADAGAETYTPFDLSF